jgi:hypothetical protein
VDALLQPIAASQIFDGGAAWRERARRCWIVALPGELPRARCGAWAAFVYAVSAPQAIFGGSVGRVGHRVTWLVAATLKPARMAPLRKIFCGDDAFHIPTFTALWFLALPEAPSRIHRLI